MVFNMQLFIFGEEGVIRSSQRVVTNPFQPSHKLDKVRLSHGQDLLRVYS
jgi:hypothetical protein